MSQNIETLCVQAGYTPGSGEPRVIPIYQSTTFSFESGEHMGKLFDLEAGGHFYTRLSNPTVEFVENKITALEGGVATICTSSGQAANLMAIINICSAGQNFVSLSSIYGGTINLFAVTLKRLGIEVRFATQEMSDGEIEQLFDENTRCLFGETLANPALTVLDLERFAALAHKHQVPFIVDNTFATPVLCRPFAFGVDIVTHSTTKYMDGHATTLGGAIVDSGNFDWQAAGKYPELTTPDDSYHGVIYTEQFGKLAYIVKARVQLMRDLGSSPQPMAAFLLNQGLDTLALRMERHSNNALVVATYFQNHPNVAWVEYPKLPSSPNYEKACRYLPKGACGVLTMGIRDGREAAMRFMDALQLAHIVVHVADIRTSVLHPASTTHRQLTDEQLAGAGVQPEMVRLSIGIEHVDDIIADIEQALAKI